MIDIQNCRTIKPLGITCFQWKLLFKFSLKSQERSQGIQCRPAHGNSNLKDTDLWKQSSAWPNSLLWDSTYEPIDTVSAPQRLQSFNPHFINLETEAHRGEAKVTSLSMMPFFITESWLQRPCPLLQIIWTRKENLLLPQEARKKIIIF